MDSNVCSLHINFKPQESQKGVLGDDGAAHKSQGSQDAAHDFTTLQKHKVSHILNVAFGVDNVFPELFIYKTVSIKDQPDTDLSLHIQDCCGFISEAQNEKGVVLVHCNTGVSRAPAVVIGYLMLRGGLSFKDALSLVQTARPNSAPNPGFMEQLQKYQTVH
ncbi:dual specificity protein phosphatase 19-like [Eucyclogobius newberryi]|uniref:dual specificity protein phosphatase 19-like n=1 Tax=Eucyclogobius newberryi TaxID=166745 RepID=UPI003B5BDFA5